MAAYSDRASRREILLSSLAAAWASATPAQAADADRAPRTPFGYAFADCWQPQALAERLAVKVDKGVIPARDLDIEAAQRIIADAPSGSPLAVMRYFAQLTATGSTGEKFNARWKYYENPVIVWFFHATGTKPDGDCTSWCAAFLSWCLERCGIPSMRSASSQDYADFGVLAKEPVAGDVVVFQNVADHRHGHVALLTSKDAANIEVIGGNQGDGGSILNCPKDYPITEIGVATRSLAGDHGQVIRSFRRYS